MKVEQTKGQKEMIVHTEAGSTLVPTIDSRSECDAHFWSEMDNFICFRHLYKPRQS